MIQRDREQLVRPQRGVVAAGLGIDDVIQIAALFVPKTLIERLAATIGMEAGRSRQRSELGLRRSVTAAR